MRFRIIAGLVLLIAATGATAQSAAPESRVAAQPEGALRLSQLVNPEKLILAAGDRAFAAGFQGSLAQDEETAALFEEHPKLLEAIMERALPVVRKHVSASLPALQDAAARFYAEKFTPAEIDQLLAFYGSPTGSKFIAGTYAGLDMSKMANAMGPDGTKAMPAETLRSMTASAAIGVLPDLDENDWKRFTEFVGTPVFAKLRGVGPDMLKLMTDIANKPNPALDAEIEEVVKQVAGEYFARLDKSD